MARSKYTYDDFVKSATASGMIGDFDGADLDAARRNPDTAMTLLSYKKDLSSALSSGNDSAAVLARSGIDALRRGYTPVGSSAVSASATPQSAPSSFGTEEAKSAPAAQSARSSAVPASPREYSNRDVQRIFEKSMGESGIGDLSDLDTDGDGKTNMRDAVRILRNISAGRGYNEYTRRQNYAVTPDMYDKEYARALGDYLATDANEVYDTDLWNAYAKQYRREGNRAAADVLGQYAGLNGGALPSYAQSAASQQRNYYASQLADRVPEIYDALRSERAGRLSALASAKEQALAEAETAAKYKDTSKLSALGIDVSRYLADEEYSRAMDEALAAAQLGDYTKFDALTGAQTGAAQRDAQRRAAAEAAMSAGDAALFDELYGTGVGDVYRRSEERTAQSTALDNAYKAASLGNLAPLASLWGMSVGELQTLIVGCVGSIRRIGQVRSVGRVLLGEDTERGRVQREEPEGQERGSDGLSLFRARVGRYHGGAGGGALPEVQGHVHDAQGSAQGRRARGHADGERVDPCEEFGRFQVLIRSIRKHICGVSRKSG